MGGASPRCCHSRVPGGPLAGILVRPVTAVLTDSTGCPAHGGRTRTRHNRCSAGQRRGSRRPRSTRPSHGPCRDSPRWRNPRRDGPRQSKAAPGIRPCRTAARSRTASSRGRPAVPGGLRTIHRRVGCSPSCASALDVGVPVTTIVGEFARRGWRVDETVPAWAAGSGSSRPPAAGQTATAAGERTPAALLLVPALDPRLLQQLAVLLLRHPLTALLDDRAQPGHHLSHKRQTGTPSHARSVGNCVDACRPRSPQAYPLSHTVVTAWFPSPGGEGGRPAEQLPPVLLRFRSFPRSAASDSAQPVLTKAALRYWLTACSGTRKERPTRIASSSPECTSR